ncbi:ATP-binding protein [Hymenobacter latericus]|uniref:ATP-binding protein n=1 Tax=Hymenobacter sp. YIM 151858-1 TaxID=2987688 RepID=UPI002226B41D|nr:hypothetical protein [Hymenobacter sp. YIM 151858-1]UYZ61320.1 hypothetical protein OIS50_20315 [Hymenobacter sp. YIM 151858-1]
MSYVDNVIDAIEQKFTPLLLSAPNGHCMKLGGVADQVLEVLWERFTQAAPKLECYILSQSPPAGESRYIQATKLIERRNLEAAPLLVLCPATLRTAAEDSLGNATFSELDLSDIEQRINQRLREQAVAQHLTEGPFAAVFKFMESGISVEKRNKFLLRVLEDPTNAQRTGHALHLLDLIPDGDLLSNVAKIPARLNYNQQCINTLCEFNKGVYERLASLPIPANPNTLQLELAHLLRNNSLAKSQAALTTLIAEQYPQLYFENWPIAELHHSQPPKLTIEEIKGYPSTVLKRDEEGKLELVGNLATPVKVKVKLSTDPKPTNIADLAHFQADLMQVVGAGNYACAIPQFDRWVSGGTQGKSRTREMKFDANLLEPGEYFLRVFALDTRGNVLNTNDDFRDSEAQAEWKRVQEQQGDAANRHEIRGRWTSDTEIFYFEAEQIEGGTEVETSRREKVSSVLQSYFRYRLDLLLRKQEPSARRLVPDEDEWRWLNEPEKQTASNFQIKYKDSPYSFQLAVSSKLRLLQQHLLQYPAGLGRLMVEAPVAGQPLAADALTPETSALNDYAGALPFLSARREFFALVSESVATKNGIFETFDLAQHREAATAYVQAYTDLLASLKHEQERWPTLTELSRANLQELLVAVQQLDMVSLGGKLPDTQERYAALLVPPIHPLRLGWQLSLLNLFERWEEMTRDQLDQQLPHWSDDIERLFFGKLQPTNHPLLVKDSEVQPYEYAGELCFGWGVFTRTAIGGNDTTLSAAGSSRSLVQYLQHVLDLRGTSSVIENDVDADVVIHHIKNYLKLHPYTEQLTINIFNPGEGQVFNDVLVKLEQYAPFKSVRYEIRLFTSHRSLVQEGEAFNRLLNPATTLTEEAETFAQPARNRLFPKLRLSINSTEEFGRTSAVADAHLSFVINPFPLTPRIQVPSQIASSFHLDGLIIEPHVDFRATQSPDTYTWTRYITPGNRPEASAGAVGEVLHQAFGYLSEFTATCLAGKPTASLPATELRLGGPESVLIDKIHTYSDWVVTFDRHLGPELFDLPVEEGQVPFLLDYLPGQQFLGVSTFLTSKPGAELVHLLSPVMQVLTGTIAPAPLASLTQAVLNDLRTVSGSLVMKLSNQPHQAKVLEYAGIALAKRLLEKQGLLNYQFIIPIDLHQHFFKANEENTSQSRADLLLIDVDPTTNTIHVQVVEIKVRTAELSTGEWSHLYEQISDQLTNTISHLRQRFDFEHFANHTRFDQPLRSRELSELLQFYAERAARYGLLTEGEPERLRLFLTQLTSMPYQMEFTRRGIVFNLDNPVKVQRDEYGDTVYYRIGRPGIEALLDPESTFNTRRPTPEWHRLRTDLTRRRPTEIAATPFPNPSPASDTIAIISNNDRPLTADSNPQNKPTSATDVSQQEGQATDTTIPSSEPTDSASSRPLDAVANETATHPESNAVLPNDESTPLSENASPAYNIYVGENEASSQYGMLGRTMHGQGVALDLNGTQTISLFGVQGAGKSYSIGTITEMVLQSIPHVNALPKPLAGVIFHYSESQDYKPEFTSMTSPNRRPGEVSRLREWYDARPQGIDDVVLVVPKAKLAERQAEYPDLRVEPLALSSAELSIQDWRFLMGAVGSQALYMKHLNSIMRDLRGNLTLIGLRNAIQNSALLNTSQRELALSRLTLAAEYLDDSVRLGQLMAPGRLLVVDLRDEFLDQDDALGLFVIMLNIFANARLPDGQPFNKFIVFDEAHKYMGNQELTGSIVTAIREMRHKGVSLLIASQDPPSLPNAIIELSTAVLIHRFNSPQWLKHVQKSIVQFDKLTPADLSQLGPGEAFLWATKATNKLVTQQPIKIVTRPRVTQHGGSTIRAAE